MIGWVYIPFSRSIWPHGSLSINCQLSINSLPWPWIGSTLFQHSINGLCSSLGIHWTFEGTGEVTYSWSCYHECGINWGFVQCYIHDVNGNDADDSLKRLHCPRPIPHVLLKDGWNIHQSIRFILVDDDSRKMMIFTMTLRLLWWWWGRQLWSCRHSCFNWSPDDDCEYIFDDQDLWKAEMSRRPKWSPLIGIAQ